MGLFLLEPATEVGTVGLESLPVDETTSSCGPSSGSRAGSGSGRADDPGRSRGLLASTSVGRAGETVRVRNGVLVTTAVGTFVGSVRRCPSLGVEVAVLANGDVVTSKNVSVEELASGLVGLQVGGTLGVASGSAKAGIERTTGEDLASKEGGLAIAVNGSVDSGVAVVGRRGVAISGLDGVVHVTVASGNNDLEAATVLTSVVCVCSSEVSTPEYALDVGCRGRVLTASTGVLAGVTFVVKVEGSTARDGVTLLCTLGSVIGGEVGETEIAVTACYDQYVKKRDRSW